MKDPFKYLLQSIDPMQVLQFAAIFFGLLVLASAVFIALHLAIKLKEHKAKGQQRDNLLRDTLTALEIERVYVGNMKERDLERLKMVSTLQGKLDSANNRIKYLEGKIHLKRDARGRFIPKV